MFSFWHGMIIALSVSVFQLLIAPRAAFSQTTSTDTTAGTPSDTLAAAASGDSLPASGDTGSVARDTVDTLPPPGSDTAAAAGSADTARPRGDSTPAAAARDSARPAAPVDSVLSTACGGPATIARDLLVVVFAPEAGFEERAAAAESVGGKVLGQAEPGAWYVKLPAEGGEAGLRAAADQLSLMSQVRQVGSRACPPPSP